MEEKTHIVDLKDQLGGRSMVSASVEIYSEHLVFLDPRGGLMAPFLSELVDPWADGDEWLVRRRASIQT
jgi:hypothetical protein